MKNERNNVVYILGSGSRWGDGEIRYSLRSLEKFCALKGVAVVGQRPAWLTNITHLEQPDVYENPLRNGIAKIERAVMSKSVSDRFMLMNDDFFFLQPVPIIKIYHKGRLAESIATHVSKAGYYYDAMIKTKAMLAEIGIDDPLDYEVHYPVIFEREKLLNALACFNGALLLRTIYGNMFNMGGEYRADIKVNAGSLLISLAEYAHLDLISTTDHVVLGTRFQSWISTKFPEPSPYENDSGEGVRAWKRNHLKGPRFTTDVPFYWKGRHYNPGDIIMGEVPRTIVAAKGLRDLNAGS